MIRKRQASQVKPKSTKAGNRVRARQIATNEAIDLAKAQINDGGMDDDNAVDAACETHPEAVRSAVAYAIKHWA